MAVAVAVQGNGEAVLLEPELRAYACGHCVHGRGLYGGTPESDLEHDATCQAFHSVRALRLLHSPGQVHLVFSTRLTDFTFSHNFPPAARLLIACSKALISASPALAHLKAQAHLSFSSPFSSSLSHML